MDPAIAAAGLQMFGNIAGNYSSAKQAAKGRAFTAAQMQNRHQWEVSDLRKAGLNPILSAGGTPGTGPSPIATQKSPADGVVNSALAVKLQKAQIGKIEADTNLVKRQTKIRGPLEHLMNTLGYGTSNMPATAKEISKATENRKDQPSDMKYSPEQRRKFKQSKKKYEKRKRQAPWTGRHDRLRINIRQHSGDY